MNFPANIESLKVLINAREGTELIASQKIKIAIDKIHAGEVVVKKHREITDILVGLCDSWKSLDPGKNKDALFFIGAVKGDRVVVREFLEKQTIICQREEFEDYNKTRPYNADYDRVPYWYEVVNFSQVATGKCFGCGQSQPIVELYAQVYDGPFGDDWLKEHFILCLDCDIKTIIDRIVLNHRF